MVNIHIKNTMNKQSVITCDLRGGLGNQLFCIFTTMAHAMDQDAESWFENKETLGGGGCTQRQTYWTSFLSALQPFLYNNNDVFQRPDDMETVVETTFHYVPLPRKRETAQIQMLAGYFQSPKYFEHRTEHICKRLNVYKHRETMMREEMSRIRPTKETTVISMHFRRGDYVPIQQYHNVLPDSYYEACLNDFAQSFRTIDQPSTKTTSSTIILYFCEETDRDNVEITIQYLQKQCPQYIFQRANHTLADWQQMILMTCCDHHIIANSTFSWWGAYLNRGDATEKRVYYPSVWFGPWLSGQSDTRDLFPPSWTRIIVE